MNETCAHFDYIGGYGSGTLQRCGRPAKRKAWRHRNTPDMRATWLCWKHFYREYLESGHWESLRERKLRTAGRRCERCGTRAHRTMKGNWAGLQVHHRTYATIGDETLDDLEVLCFKCHEQHHGIAV